MTPITILLVLGLITLMSFIRKIKKKNNRVYYAEVKNQRVNGKVKQIHIRYIGDKPDAPKRKFEIDGSQLKYIAKRLADKSLTPDDIFDILEKKGEPITRYELEKMGIQYNFVKKTLFITLYPLKTGKGTDTARPAKKGSPSGKLTKGRK